MEGMNWLSFPLFESLNHDLAIRRFCPARVEIERGEWEEALNEMESFSPSEDTSTTHLAASEVDDFIDSFINMDDHHHDNKEDEDEDDENSSKTKHREINVGLEFELDHCQDGSLSTVDYGYEDVPIRMEPAEIMVPSVDEVSHGVDQGLHLVHLLLACAEAVGCRDTQLAESMLGQIWASATPWGDSLQRVSYCFVAGLKSRLQSLLHNVSANGAFTNYAVDAPLITREEKMEAFQLLYQTTPYIAFGFMAANEAICQAAQGNDSLHILDLGMQHTLQWPSLIRTLASRPQGPPRIQITGLITDDKSQAAELEASMKSLAEEASLLGIPLEFNMISGPATQELFTRENLNLKEGEALFVNSITHLHKYVKESRGSLKAILQAIKKLGPTLLTVVEQDANHNGPFFLGRFLESLHYYSAIFDSLEACLPRNSPQRMKMERHHFAEEIRNIVAYEGSDRIERHERADQWRRQLGRAGFQVMGLKCLSQARMMLSVYGCDGYTLATEKGCLLLGWKGRPIMLASAWQLHNPSSS